jgi:ElaA protein
MKNLDWNCLTFEEISSETLYNILQLRSEVFVVEQECVYQDMDNYDQDALHVIGVLDGNLVCYARILAPGKKYSESSIGRIVNSPDLRGQGYGKVLVNEALTRCEANWPGQGVRISAQHRLMEFYQALGFVAISDTYLEDGIPHIEMLFDANRSVTQSQILD